MNDVDDESDYARSDRAAAAMQAKVTLFMIPVRLVTHLLLGPTGWLTLVGFYAAAGLNSILGFAVLFAVTLLCVWSQAVMEAEFRRGHSEGSTATGVNMLATAATWLASGVLIFLRFFAD